MIRIVKSPVDTANMTPCIAAYRGRSFISYAIRAFNWGPYSHVSWILADGVEIEAWSGGVLQAASIGANHTEGTCIDLFAIQDLAPETRQAIDLSMRAAIGLKYDYPGICGFLLRAPWLQREDRVFCSELVFSRCLSNGVPILQRIPAYKVSPSLLTLSPVLVPCGSIVAGKPREAEMIK